MKILVISHTYVVSVNQQKIDALATLSDLEVGLVAPISWKSAYGEVKLRQTPDRNFKLFPIDVYFSGNNNRFIFQPGDMTKIFRSFRPELVQVEEEPWSAACLQATLLAKLVGAKVVFFTWENMERKLRPYYGLARKTNYANADGAIAGNREAQELLKRQGFNKPVEIIPQLGVNLEFFKNSALPDTFTIGYIGRLDEQKGILNLLQAYSALKNKPKMIIVGAGSLENKIRNILAEDSLKEIELINDAQHDQIPTWLQKMSVLVLPSLTTPVWKEQFGHVLIEAMAAGRVVVGSNSGAIPEVIDDAGLVFAEGNAQELAANIEKLQKDSKLLKTLAGKAFDRVKKYYTHDIIARRTAHFYRQIVD